MLSFVFQCQSMTKLRISGVTRLMFNHLMPKICKSLVILRVCLSIVKLRSLQFIHLELAGYWNSQQWWPDLYISDIGSPLFSYCKKNDDHNLQWTIVYMFYLKKNNHLVIVSNVFMGEPGSTIYGIQLVLLP